MKIKYKMIIDICMAIILVFVMQYGFTGGFVHELIGVVLIAGFIVHVAINRKYYFVAGKILSSNKNKWKNRITFILNILLIVSTVLMLISSLAISKDILGKYNLWIENTAIWRFIHVTCAYVMVCVIAAHVVLHYQMIMNIIRKITGLKCVSGAWNISVRIVAAVLAVLLLKTSVDNVLDSIDILGSYYAYKKTYVSEYVYGNTSNSVVAPTVATADIGDGNSQTHEKSSEQSTEAIDKSENSIKIEKETLSPASDNEIKSEAITNTTEAQTKESLNDYLSKLTCTGCSKHCSLLAPQCSKGVVQRNSAEKTYNSMS